MNFVKASLKHRQVTFAVLLLFFAFGVYSLLNMPRREDPKIVIPAGLVVAYFPGADAAQVEDQVTHKLEEFLYQFEEVHKEKTYSITSDGVVELHVWLQDNVKKPDIFWSKLRHQLMILKAVDLPQGVRGPIVNSDFGDTETMIIGLSSDEAGFTELKDYVMKLEEDLRQIPAISKLKRIGEQKEQITVGFNSEKMSQFDISLPQVVKILQSQNTINASGDIRTEEISASLYTTGYYKTENDIRDQIVGASKTGAVVRLKDIAGFSRGYAEPDSKITVDGKKAVLLALQMYEGMNVVKAGKEVQRKLNDFAGRLPGNIKLTTIVNQPDLVRRNVSEFLREFLLAVISVMLVVFLLLPFRIAVVAAAAIPMTISITFALLYTFGIELHQVSLASMISVLGIVVDDAIIIADNYVELLDRGHDRWTSAWRSATDLVVPVLTATITIIASFLPLVILKGTIGEFIRALPITVTIALSSSFLVAMFLTPLLCYIFIRKGLHSPGESDKARRASFLDILQKTYNKTIEWCLRHSRITIAGSFCTILLAVLLFEAGIKQKFFPDAERDQFTVELWMPTGTKLEKTEKAIQTIGNLLKGDSRIESYATFIGRSAPRFYYNYSPQMPESNFAQILINTTSSNATKSLYRDLTEEVKPLVPEGQPNVKLMQQGQPLNAHIEVRISGEDLSKLKQIGSQVTEIIRKTPGSDLLGSDFKEDYYGIRINLRNEAGRLGFTTSSITQAIYTGFTGYPVSVLYEGKNPVDIVLRLDERQRRSIENLENMYLQSPLTGASVPLRQIAELKPGWQTGRIIHRNGIRTLTIQSETKGGLLPSEFLREIKPQLEKIDLPPGYRIYFGGEYFNQHETFGVMLIALAISLIIIFMVLLFQFRNLKEVGLVMLTIPLSLLGAIFGLYVTGNDFGFMAFCGLISLSGIEVRNAIILIDHTNELLKKGMDIPTAAYEAGKRRLRPIFLTAMAAAIGVLPMILSGSPLWSPLASVIAFGVVWSMLISTLSIPVFYKVTIKPDDKKNISEAFKPMQNEIR
ncbi:MAG: efflux RND transporter permease subunit [Bacteroidota bacterium]|nr:efflux RND transporter permease subunit [Bacteroidota bacterium]